MTWVRRRAGRPLVLAHRGASAEETENTLAAFAAAHAAGADGVEFDIQLTADGELIVFHDADLKRLADEHPGVVESMTAAELRRIPLRGGHHMPTLEQALAAVPAPMLINVELKTSPRSRWRIGAVAAAALARSPARDRIVVSSFDPAALATLRMAEPRLPIGLLFYDQLALPLRRAWAAGILGANALHPHHKLVTSARMARWQRRHLSIAAWTVDHPAELRRLARLGVHAVFSNDPRAAQAALSST